MENTISETKGLSKGQLNTKLFTYFALLATLLSVSSTDIYISSLPQMVLDFNTNPATVNLTISAYTLGMAVSVLFTGILSNRFGRRSILLSGIAIYMLSSFLIAIIPSIWLIIGLRVLQAYGCACVSIVARLVFKDTMDPKEQLHASGIVVMGVVISPAIAPSIGAFLAKFWGWESCFILSGIFGMVLLMWGLGIIKETNTTPTVKLNSILSYAKEYTNLLTDKICLHFTLAIGFAFAAYFPFIGISSYLFINTLGMTPLIYSYLFIIIASGYFIGNTLMMILNRNQMAPIKIMTIGVYISIIGFLALLVSLFISQKILLISLLVLGIIIMRSASALIITPAQVKLMEHYKDKGGLALGLCYSAEFGLSSFAVCLVALFHNHPLGALIGVTALCFAPVTMVMPLLNKSVRH